MSSRRYRASRRAGEGLVVVSGVGQGTVGDVAQWHDESGPYVTGSDANRIPAGAAGKVNVSLLTKGARPVPVKIAGR